MKVKNRASNVAPKDPTQATEAPAAPLTPTQEANKLVTSGGLNAASQVALQKCLEESEDAEEFAKAVLAKLEAKAEKVAARKAA